MNGPTRIYIYRSLPQITSTTVQRFYQVRGALRLDGNPRPGDVFARVGTTCIWQVKKTAPPCVRDRHCDCSPPAERSPDRAPQLGLVFSSALGKRSRRVGAAVLVAIYLVAYSAALSQAWGASTPLPPQWQPVSDAYNRMLADLQALNAKTLAAFLSQMPFESVEGTTISPGGKSIVDASKTVWTISPSELVLKNGASFYQNWQSTKLVYHNHLVYLLGLDGNWYYWNGSAPVKTTAPI